MKSKIPKMLAVLVGCAIGTGCAGTKHEPTMAGCSIPYLRSDVPNKMSASAFDNQFGGLVHESLKKTPEAYKHIVVAPVWFSAAANCDRSFSSNELAQVTRESGQTAAALIAQSFTNSGYQVSGPVRAICNDSDLNALDAETRTLLNQVRADFQQLSLDIHDATNLPFRFKLKTPLPLLAKLGNPQADALVLVDSTAFVETPRDRHKRYAWNVTGGPLLTAVGDALLLGVTVVAIGGGGAGGVPDWNLMSSMAMISNPNHINETIAIIDLRTQDVLFWNSITRKGNDLREPTQLKATIAVLLSSLRPITRETVKK